MPIYDFECRGCGNVQELFSSYDDRDKSRKCDGCGKRKLKRLPGFGAVHGPAYQMKAVMSDGTHVAGHFGKTAKSKRKGK